MKSNSGAVLLWLVLGLFAVTAHAQVAGCDAAVDFNGEAITVAAIDGEDTSNIGCALEAARDMAVPTVRLEQGRFDVSTLTVRDFEGTLRGTTRETTILALIPDTVDCSALRADRISPAGLKFIGGAPTVQYLTVEAINPCLGGAHLPFYAIHFTGPPNSEGCGADLVYATVDRVSFVSDGPNSFGMHGIGAFAEDDIRGGCKNTLLGRLRINRSSFGDLSIGTKLSLKGKAEVAITHNEFENNRAAIVIFDSGQLTTIAGNSIFTDSSVFPHPLGISLFRARDDAPTRTQFAIHDNVIEMEGFIEPQPGIPGEATGIQLTPGAPQTTISVTSNRFEVNGSTGRGIFIAGVENPFIGDNVFIGDSLPAVALGTFADPMSDAVIVGNDFSRHDAFPDILLGESTVRAYVGPAQGDPLVEDEGVDNRVIGARER